MTTALEILQERGLVEQISDENLGTILEKDKTTMYVGFDPTADSLHLGHLVPIMALSHFQRSGHNVIALVGGATGMVGDPSGKADERNLQTPYDVTKNVDGLKKQLANFLDFSGSSKAVMLDNNDWISPMSFIDWLRDVGKYFTVNHMLAKESVKQRVNSERGISFTEFSYMTMQAFDFLHLFKAHNCTIQGGGNDQWGNITAGIDLVRKVTGKKVHGITFPLLTTSKGDKFGKSAGNAIWFDPDRTSPYKFYQYLIQTTDEDVEKFLKFFTFLSLEEIEQIYKEHCQQPEERLAQKRLAAELTKIVHGKNGLQQAMLATKALFGGDLRVLSKKELTDVFDNAPSSFIDKAALESGIGIVNFLVEAKVVESKSHARRMIKQGGL